MDLIIIASLQWNRPLDAPHSGFWKRYSLRGLFVAMTLCCVLLGLWSAFVNPFRQQAESLAVLRRLSVEVRTYPAQGAAWQRWLVTTMLGDDAFVEVEGIELRGPRIDDAAIKELSGLRQLRSLTLEQTGVTDAGLSVLKSMHDLQDLTLSYSLVTDRGIEQLKSLPKLATLKLTGTKITDALVPELAKFPALQTLYLRFTRVTDEGVAKLRELAPNCTVFHHALPNTNAP